MEFWESKLSWKLLFIAILGDILIPYILGMFYPGYSQIRDVMSILGNPESPVSIYYNIWLMIAGVLLLLSAFNLYKKYYKIHPFIGYILFILISTFAIGDCMISSIFSTHSDIHSVGSSVGFSSLALVSLIIATIYLKKADFLESFMCIILFLISISLFLLFLSSVNLTGLWQRLLLIVIYLPLLYESIKNIKA